MDETCTIQNDQVPILLMTPPPCNVALWRQVDPNDTEVPDNGNDIYRSYGDQMKQIAQRHDNCSVVDTWSLLDGNNLSTTILTEQQKQQQQNSSYQTDGVHLTAKGNRVVFEGLMDVIRRDYPHLIPMTDGNGQFGSQGIPLEGKLWWMY